MATSTLTVTAALRRRASGKIGLAVVGEHWCALVVFVGGVALAISASTRAVWARQAPVDERFGTIAEGLTAQRIGGSITAGHRMLTVPDFGGVCEAARAAAMRRLRQGSARVRWRVNRGYDYHSLEVEALDARGRPLPSVPISAEVEQSQELLQWKVADGMVTAVAPGVVRLRVRTFCAGRGVETFIVVEVLR